jgi:beta-phosphoglucomutase-like phosphatase (HAD superfamily)
MRAVRALLDGAGTVLFDFDGVIADTEVHQLAAYRQLLAAHGVTFGADDFQSYIGRSEAEVYAILKREYGLELDVRAATASRLALFFESVYAAGLRPYPFIAGLLADLRVRGIPAHIVSSNVTDTIERLLGEWQLDMFIDEIFTVEEATPGTSKLDLVVAIPERLGVPVGRTAVFEDSARVIAVARAAGMRTVGVRHSLNRAVNLGAHVEIDSA